MGRMNGGDLGLLGLVVIGLVGGRCRLLILVCELSMLCCRCALCLLLWCWPACSVSVCWVGDGEASGLRGSRWA